MGIGQFTRGDQISLQN